MARTDYITGTLNGRYQSCLTRTRRRRTECHWRSYPILAGRSIEAVAAIVGDANHPDHNAVAAALLITHRDRQPFDDDTEMTLLLCAARPLVLALDPGDRHDDSRAVLWCSVARRLQLLVPDDVATAQVPFLVALLGRLRPDAQYRRRPVELTLVPAASLEQRICPHPDNNVAARAIARIYLAAARRQPGWDDLVRYTTQGATRSNVHSQRAARHRSRIATTIGYVA